MRIDAEAKQQLEAKHGECLVLETEIGDVAFRVASMEEFQAFMDQVHDEELRPRAAKDLLFTVRVAPEEPEFVSLLKRRPGLITTLGNVYIEHCGGKKSAVRKK